MASWDEQLNQVRKQLSELQLTLSQSQQSTDKQTECLKEARQKIEQLLDGPSNARSTLFQLPLVLHALTEQKLVGAALIGKDGKVLMHHSRLPGIDPVTNTFAEGWFFDGETGSPLAHDALPWQRCMRGEQLPEAVRIIIRLPSAPEEDLHIAVSAVAFSDGDEISGAVALFRDVSETIQADTYMRRLVHKLEQQMRTIETAQRELNALSEKLGGASATQGGSSVNAGQAKSGAGGSGSAPGTGGGPAKVLVVDDIPVNQQLLIMQLKKLGIKAEIANNGAEAVGLCTKNTYALVFMDLDMPVLNGFEATAAIRKNERARGMHTPIVALTSYDREEDTEKCVRAGMDDYLTKSVSKGRLWEIINHYVLGNEPVADDKQSAPPPAQDIGADAKLDFEWLKDKFPDRWQQLTSSFFRSASTLINCLEFAIEEKDASSVNHFALSLRDPCATIGLAGLGRVTANIIECAERDRWQDASQNYKILRGMYAALKEQAGGLAENQFLAANPS